MTEADRIKRAIAEALALADQPQPGAGLRVVIGVLAAEIAELRAELRRARGKRGPGRERARMGPRGVLRVAVLRGVRARFRGATVIQIVHANCQALPIEAFDAFDTMIVDPPYSEHVHRNAASMGTAGAGPVARDLGFACLTPELRWRVAEIAGRVRRWSVVFSDFEDAMLWRPVVTQWRKTEYVRLVPWVRWSQPQLSGDRPPTGAEAVLHFHAAGRKRWNGPGSLTHYARRCLRGAEKHPTEKPLDLALDLVSWFSDPGESVVDPCGGAGTVALACRLLGRDCVSLEADARWIDVAERRVSLASWLPRDLDRAGEWCATTDAEASTVPAPRAADGSDVRTWERAQRRLADVARVAEALP